MKTNIQPPFSDAARLQRAAPDVMARVPQGKRARPSRALAIVLSPALVLLLTSCATAPPVAPINPSSAALDRVVCEKLLARMETGFNTRNLWIAADPTPTEALAISSLRVSPDSRHVIWVQRERGKYLPVVDGQKQSSYDRIASGRIQPFSTDSQHWSYLAKQGDKVFALIDGKETELPYFDESLFAGRQASNHIAYAAKKEGSRYWVVDGQPGKTYDELFPHFEFSPGGQHFIYSARQGKKDVFVRDGQEAGTYDFLEQAAFSPDGKRLAYVVGEGERPKEPWYSKVSTTLEILGAVLARNPHPRVHPTIVDKAKRHVVLDGQEGPSYDAITSLTFSPDGRRFAYKARRGQQCLVVIDGYEDHRVFDFFTRKPIQFSQDGKRVAYVGGRGDKLIAMVDDNETIFDDIVEGPIFSPDGQHVAIVPIEGQVFYVLLDGQRGKNYYAGNIQLWPAMEPVSLVFSPNSQHIAYWAQDRNFPQNRRFVVLDGTEGKIWDQVQGRIVFDSNERLHYVAAKGDRHGIDLYLVEEKVP